MIIIPFVGFAHGVIFSNAAQPDSIVEVWAADANLFFYMRQVKDNLRSFKRSIFLFWDGKDTTVAKTSDWAVSWMHWNKHWWVSIMAQLASKVGTQDGWIWKCFWRPEVWFKYWLYIVHNLFLEETLEIDNQPSSTNYTSFWCSHKQTFLCWNAVCCFASFELLAALILHERPFRRTRTRISYRITFHGEDWLSFALSPCRPYSRRGVQTQPIPFKVMVFSMPKIPKKPGSAAAASMRFGKWILLTLLWQFCSATLVFAKNMSMPRN